MIAATIISSVGSDNMTRRSSIGTWGNAKPARTATELSTLAVATKLRTLADMTEQEIKALEKQYGVKIQRPDARPSQRRSRPPR